jgi:uncharacterized protein
VPPVRVEFSKWGGARHWHFDVESLGTDRHGTWFCGGPGLVLQRGEEEPILKEDGFVLLVPVEGDWIASWNSLDDVAVYVDVTDTPVLSASSLRAVDLDLDVIALRDGRVEVVDRDEFDAHQVALGYPPEVVARAEATALELEALMKTTGAPFDGTGEAWLEKAAASWAERR